MGDRTAELEALLRDKERELEEFQADSKEYETELENEISRLEKEKRDFLAAKELQDREIDGLRTRVADMTQASGNEVGKLQQTIEALQKTLDECNERIRELETRNDDLERSCRCVLFSWNFSLNGQGFWILR